MCVCVCSGTVTLPDDVALWLLEQAVTGASAVPAGAVLLLTSSFLGRGEGAKERAGTAHKLLSSEVAVDWAASCLSLYI